MERGSKRKAAALATSPTIERSAKRQRTPVPEAPARSSKASKQQQEVNDAGARYLARVRDARDNKDNLIATDFLNLPPRSQYPDYYAHTPLPIALDTIEKKIGRSQYSTIAEIESDAKRMIQNAKSYNEPKSEIHSNAERMRKITSQFMKQNNPGYSQPDYVCPATPLPGEEMVVPDESDEVQKAPAKIRLRATKSATNPPPEAKKEEPEDEEPAATGGGEGDYKGKGFQEAQEQIINELMEHKDGDVLIFQPFQWLPSRKLTDYYQLIKQPTSLNSIWKRIRGITGGRGKEKETGQTELRTWDALENAISLIWENARLYNEDGSDIDLLSKEFEDYFRERLSEAKKHVKEPAPPTLKLNMSKPAAAPIKLRLGSQKASPAPAAPNQVTPSAPTPAAATSKITNGVTPGPTTAASKPPTQTGATATAPVVNGVKAESHASTPPVTDQQPTRPTSQHSGLAAPPKMVNGASHAVPNTFTNHTHTATAGTGFDNKFRQDGKDATNALISKVSIVTHTSLQLPPGQKHLDITVPASDLLTQQYITLNVPPSQTHLQIYPIVSSLLSSNKNRPFRLFVTSNGQRLNPTSVSKPSDQTGGPPQNGYDVRLNPGMNRIEVECVAVAEGALGAGTLAGKGGLEMERVGVFVHLLRG